MDALGDLLGQGRLADEIASKLEKPRTRVWLKGPPGSGKSTIANLVAERLITQGVVIRLSGDAAQVGTRFLAASRALAGTRWSRQFRDALPAAALSPLRVVPVAGSALAEWARLALLSAKHKRPEFLSADQLDVLEGFQRLAVSQRTFIIVDDVGWLDPDTAQILAALEQPEVSKAFSFAEHVSMLLVENDEVSPTANAEALKSLRSPTIFHSLSASRDDFGRVLAAFGLTRQLDPALLSDLHAISRGHLEIAKQIVKLDQGTDLAALLAKGDVTALMAELLDKRVTSLRGSSALLHLLSLAACAGSIFSEAELRCAFADQEAFTTALQAACREDLLVPDGEALRFVHDIVRAAAERLASKQAADLHARLAECLKRLRPGDYASRLRHLRLSGAGDPLAQVAFAFEMQSVRGDASLARFDPGELGPFQALVEVLREGYRLMDAGEHRRAIDLVLPHYDATASLVQGEVVMLLALNQIKRRMRDGYGAAIALLESWRERRDEPELWQRLMSVLATALSNFGEAGHASQLYRVLTADLAGRPASDNAARARLEALNRKADMFLASEISAKHIRKAAAWFGPQSEGEMPRNAFEYTACTINLSGALFTFGQFEEAAASARTAMAWTELLQQRGLRSAEPYKALNNYAIASFRAGTALAGDLSRAIETLEPIGLNVDRGDRSLLICNWASLSMLDGNVGEAARALRVVWTRVQDSDADPYYTLYVGANLAVAEALLGSRRAAGRMLNEVAPCLSALPNWVQRAHRRRHDIMLQAVRDSSFRTPADLDSAPLRIRQPDGDQDPWWSIGRGLLMSDIQVWSEG